MALICQAEIPYPRAWNKQHKIIATYILYIVFWDFLENKPGKAYSHDLSKIAIMDYQRQSRMTKDYHGLSRTTKDYQGLSRTVKVRDGLSWTVMDCHHGLAWTGMDWHGLALTGIGCHGL